jgi:DNA-binding NtrC family response regulator
MTTAIPASRTFAKPGPPAGRTKERVLVVDDDSDTLDLLSELLGEQGYEVCLATCAKDLRSFFEAAPPEVTLLDWRLPDGNGLDLLVELKGRWPETQVIMLTSFATFDVAVQAIKRGAYHFQVKPFQAKVLLRLVREACALRRGPGPTHPADPAPSGEPIFASQAMKDLLRLVGRVAPSDASILITGESGTGKEVIADLVHAQSKRAHGPLIKVNCAALPRELIESELFGSIKGAFTGAYANREGLFRQAQGGTILLDEISEMPLDTQSKLLRVLQYSEFRPVGAKDSLKADCRVLASTNRRIEDAIRDSKLREDLYYRISTVTLQLPPLRERREDILPIAHAFLQRFATRAGSPVAGFTPAAAELLQHFDWPGNVRQLENEIHRAVLVSEGPTVDITNLSLNPNPPNVTPIRASSRLVDVEFNAILTALEANHGNKAAAARQLGLTRQTLYNKLRQYGLASAADKPDPNQSLDGE